MEIGRHKDRRYNSETTPASGTRDQKCKTCGAYIGRGYEYGKSGNSSKAIEDFKMAVQLDPNNDAASNFLQEALDGTITY